MFHMLGRFAFTSSFSRRSSPGFSTDTTRFGFCFCESGPLSVFMISHPSFIRPPIPARSAYRSPGDVPQHLIWVRSRSITRPQRTFCRLLGSRHIDGTSVDPPLPVLEQILSIGDVDDRHGPGGLA